MTRVTGSPCSVNIDSGTTLANTDIVVRLYGYDQFDRLVREDIRVAAADTDGLSKHAYKELIQLELVSAGSVAVTSLDVAIKGVSDHDGFSVGLTGTLIPSPYIGLPCIVPDPKAIRAVIVAQSSADGYVRWLGEDTWSVQSEAASIPDSTSLKDTDVMNVGAGTLLLPGFTTVGGVGRGVVVFDYDYSLNYL